MLVQPGFGGLSRIKELKRLKNLQEKEYDAAYKKNFSFKNKSKK